MLYIICYVNKMLCAACYCSNYNLSCDNTDNIQP